MNYKIVTLMLLSGIISGCAIYPDNNKKQTTKVVSKKVVTKPQQNKKPQVAKKAITPIKSKVVEEKNPIVTTNKIVPSSNTTLPAMKNTKALNNKYFNEDKALLLKCEKSSMCLKEIVIIDESMLLKVEIPDNVYNEIKNKDNLITYYNNDVKIFKTNPNFYLKKYGLIHKKYINAPNMLKNLPEVLIKDIFDSKIYVRFKPF